MGARDTVNYSRCPALLNYLNKKSIKTFPKQKIQVKTPPILDPIPKIINFEPKTQTKSYAQALARNNPALQTPLLEVTQSTTDFETIAGLTRDIKELCDWKLMIRAYR